MPKDKQPCCEKCLVDRAGWCSGLDCPCHQEEILSFDDVVKMRADGQIPSIHTPSTREWLDKLDAEIMEWLYEMVKECFDTEFVHDSTKLRKILEENLSFLLASTRREVVEEVKRDMLAKTRGWHGTATAMITDYFSSLTEPNKK